jgi:meso-butanediol dehydrogenase / (S,S)-butanediol dehydrogenase / diacetyl reductase
MWGLDGRTAIVTGAGNGIGRATAELLGSAGVNVVAVDVDEAAVNETCRGMATFSRRPAALAADISDPRAVQRMGEFAMERFGRIDILFANAAVQLVKPMAETTDAEWDQLMGVNLKGVFLCCRAVIPSMRNRRSGTIIISASGHAFATYRGFSVYGAAKGAVMAFMRGVALDYAADGIRANCVIPGATDTRMIQSFFDESPNPEAARRNMEERIPLGRLATPADVAKAVLFLASDHASYITGTSLAVDGGLMAQG